VEKPRYRGRLVFEFPMTVVCAIYDQRTQGKLSYSHSFPLVTDYWSGLRDQVLRIRSEEHTSELQSRENLVCRLLLEKKIIAAMTAMYNGSNFVGGNASILYPRKAGLEAGLIITDDYPGLCVVCFSCGAARSVLSSVL